MNPILTCLLLFGVVGTAAAHERNVAHQPVASLIEASRAEVSVAFRTLVVLVRGIDDEDESAELIASISSVLYEANQQ